MPLTTTGTQQVHSRYTAYFAEMLIRNAHLSIFFFKIGDIGILIARFSITPLSQNKASCRPDRMCSSLNYWAKVNGGATQLACIVVPNGKCVLGNHDAGKLRRSIHGLL